MAEQLDYERDIRIEPHALDKEWLDAASVYMRYSRALADKRDELARAEQLADVERAEADKRARQRHTGDEKKPTEAVINSEVLTDDKLKAAQDKLLDLKHEVDILQGAVRAFDHRKAALENLVTLHGQQYFAGPVVPHDIGREFVRGAEQRGRETARERTASRTGGRSR